MTKLDDIKTGIRLLLEDSDAKRFSDAILEASLRQALDDYFPGRPVILIFGASEDKDVPGMFAAWKPRLQTIIAAKAEHPRALAPEQIVELARQAGILCEAVPPVAAALDRALNLAGEETIVLSAGSMFVTAEVMTAWRKRNMT